MGNGTRKDPAIAHEYTRPLPIIGDRIARALLSAHDDTTTVQGPHAPGAARAEDQDRSALRLPHLGRRMQSRRLSADIDPRQDAAPASISLDRAIRADPAGNGALPSLRRAALHQSGPSLRGHAPGQHG